MTRKSLPVLAILLALSLPAAAIPIAPLARPDVASKHGHVVGDCPNLAAYFEMRIIQLAVKNPRGYAERITRETQLPLGLSPEAGAILRNLVRVPDEPPLRADAFGTGGVEKITAAISAIQKYPSQILTPLQEGAKLSRDPAKVIERNFSALRRAFGYPDYQEIAMVPMAAEGDLDPLSITAHFKVRNEVEFILHLSHMTKLTLISHFSRVNEPADEFRGRPAVMRPDQQVIYQIKDINSLKAIWNALGIHMETLGDRLPTMYQNWFRMLMCTIEIHLRDHGHPVERSRFLSGSRPTR